MNKPDIKNGFSSLFGKLSRIKIKGVDIAVTLFVIVFSCLIIIPSIMQCVTNREKAACEIHMSKMINILSNELSREETSGGSYWHDLILNGNYQKLITSLTERSGEGKKFPASSYYISTGYDKISITCKEHKDISEKELSFSRVQDINNVSVAEKPLFGGMLAYLAVRGPDTYYQNDSLDENNPSKMVFHGVEIDNVIQNISVYATHIGGYREELPKSRYTILCEKLDMTKPGQVKLMIKSNATSVWDNSSYVPFVIDIVGEKDAAPLIVDGGRNGIFELASWDWHDYASEAEQTGAELGASIVRYKGKYYYYPDGFYIVSGHLNNDPFTYAVDIDDWSKSAYYIEFDTDSVILNSRDEKKIHEGSLKVENGSIYIWQDNPSKELPEGWIRVYCDVTKY